MSRYIDADKLQRDLAYRWYDAPKRLSGIKVSMLIDEQPTADVAEVVRCKDCKHYKTNIPCVGGHYNGCIEWLNEGCAAEVNEDDFCSYGEKHE